MIERDVEAIMAEQKRRDWLGILAPTILGLAVSLATTAGGAAWYFGNVNSRLAAVENEVRSSETDRVTQRDLQQRDTALQIYQQEMNIRLNRMDDKLDLILENQNAKGQHN